MAVAVKGLRLDAWEEYAHGTRGEHFEWWAREFLILGQDRFAGTMMELEQDWQAPIMHEALSVETSGVPYWRTVVIVLPRKNGKTMTLGAYADYELDTALGEPEILLAAASAKQADRLYGACAGFVRRNRELRERMVLRQYIGEIARADGAGMITRLSSEGDTQHGANPSLVIIDELHVWRTEKLRRSWGALTTADGARQQSQVFAITTEGEAAGRDESLLGQMVDENERLGVLEQLPGLTVSRDHESRTLIYRWHAVSPTAADPRPLRAAMSVANSQPSPKAGAACAKLERALVESVMPANPASWITEEYILRQALSSKVMTTDFLQLHANVAADSRQRWIPREVWNDLRSDESPKLGSEIAVAVDAALTHDTTAVAWAWKIDDGRVGVRTHVWAARQAAKAHEYVPGGRIRNDPVKDYIRELSERYRVVELAYDPRFFEDAATELADEGFNVFPLHQGETPMRDAEQHFHDAVAESSVTHDGDTVLAAHVAAAVAEKTDRGWKVRKLRQTEVIDALIAAIMAHYRARRLVAGTPWAASW